MNNNDRDNEDGNGKYSDYSDYEIVDDYAIKLMDSNGDLIDTLYIDGLIDGFIEDQKARGRFK